MNYSTVNELLKKVIADALSINIPISEKIANIICIDETRYDRVAACYKYKFPERYEIHLSPDVLMADEHEIKNIIAHEVLHTCASSMPHEGIWKLYQGKMNRHLGYNIQVEYSWCELLNE